ncbi:hypothetical protein ACFO5R_08855 [Halosolutus amylolyticus]|uniref:C2H2-type domain-containing protein n=1 Tax=Halosolutus amylolyticus TaxID=2932267 RepID=A0ABD5PNV8_9EURY|nr:hypothetical protein [Halosolutus amylolyticus]
MATRPPPECPVCHDGLDPGRCLEEHLLESHTKRTLARFVVAETTVLEEDISE